MARWPLAALDSRLQRGHVPKRCSSTGRGCRAPAAGRAAWRLLDTSVSRPPSAGGEGWGGESAPAGTGFRLSPPEDKKVIAVDQVRELVRFTSLTSHRGGRKVALIAPAEAMTSSAANSLLKTLEEPAGASTIILVGSALARLPATVVSRCERVRLVPPTREVALRWLQSVDPEEHWPALLDFAAGAPLQARELAAAGFATTMQRLEEDLEQLLRREDTPLAVGRRWARLDTGLCLRWLYGQVTRLARAGLAGASGSVPVNTPLKIPADHLNMAACYDYLDRVAQAMRLIDRGLNMEVQIADLLMWWYGWPYGMPGSSGQPRPG